MLAKRHLVGIRENAVLTLHEMGLMQPKVKRALAEDVLPWLIAKTQGFLDEDREALSASGAIVEEGILMQKQEHMQTLKRMDQWRKDQAQAKKDAEIAKLKRRADRKLAREKREKDRLKAKMEGEIKKFMIDKGGVCVSGIASEVLLDAHGCYEKGKPFLGALGGQIQQWYYVIAAINQVYANEDPRLFALRVQANPSAPEAKKAATPKELTMDQFLIPFLLVAFKELKTEYIQLVNTPFTQKMCDQFKVPYPAAGAGYDLSKLNKDQYLQFRHVFVEKCMYHDVFLRNKD